ncbi:MAG: PP2C family protein-serine/threonine phosphatase [Candidatus Micrarchaeaceae archaeon]
MSYSEWPFTQVYDERQMQRYVAARQPELVNIEEVCRMAGVSFDAGAASLPSPARPLGNEDEVLIMRGRDERGGPNGTPFYAVFDGMGGHELPEYAAVIGHMAMRQMFDWAGMVMEPGTARKTMADALMSAHGSVASFAGRYRHDIGSTVVAARPFMTPNGVWMLAVGHAGDSRLLEFAEDGQVYQLTIDHSAIRGWDAEKQRRFAVAERLNDLPKAERKQFLEERHGIVADLGHPVHRSEGLFRYKTQVYELMFGSTYVLCTDGVTDPLTYPQMQEIVGAAKPVGAAYALVDRAQRVYGQELAPRRIWGMFNVAGKTFRGKRDDASAIVFRATKAYAQRSRAQVDFAGLPR